MRTTKNAQVPPGYHMIFCDVKSVFANVPLEYTIGLVLERIYDKGELVIIITRSQKKETLCLCKMVVLAIMRISTYRNMVFLWVSL